MIELPRNLKPKTKIAIFYLQHLVYGIVFLFLSFKVIEKFISVANIALILKLMSIVIAIIVILFEYDGRNFIRLLADFIRYVLASKYVSKKEKFKRSKYFIKRKGLDECERHSQLNSFFNIKDIDSLIANDGYYHMFLEVEIKLNPKFETKREKRDSIEEFNKLLIELEENGKLFTVNSSGAEHLEKIKLDKYKQNAAYFNLKKYQWEYASKFMDLRYFIEIKDRNKDNLNMKANVLCTNFKRNLQVKKVNEATRLKLISRIATNLNSEIRDSYVYNKKLDRYEAYISLNSFNTKQEMYYLKNLFSCEYDVTLLYRKPSDISDMKTLNSAYAELMSSQKYDKTITGKIKNDFQKKQLFKITNDLEAAKGELFSLEIIIQVVAPNQSTLVKRLEQLKVFFKGKIKFNENIYLQRKYLKMFYQIGVEITDNYILPDEHLSYSYPFNYVKFIQSGGLLKNVDRENLLVLDYQRKSNNQLSFGFMIFGDKGSGKSTYLKEKALDDIYHYNGNVIMLDFDSETETMVRNFNGMFVDIAGMPINILRVNINPLSINNIEDHIVFIVNCLKTLYLDIPERYTRKILSKIYRERNITNDNIFEIKDYPTFCDVLKVVQEEEGFEPQKLAEIIEDMDILYPYLTQSDRGFEFEKQFISISFNSIKHDENLTNMMMFYFVTLISRRTSLNYFSTKYYPNDDERLLKYLEYYMKLTNDYSNFEYVKNFTRHELKDYFENNKKMFSIIIDESHRIFNYPLLVKSLIPIAREDRKYFTSLTFADQSTHSLEMNDDFLLIYSLMQYKIFFSLEETNIKFLNKLNFLEQEINDITSGRLGAGSGILKIGSKTYKINSRISNEMDKLFEGRN